MKKKLNCYHLQWVDVWKDSYEEKEFLIPNFNSFNSLKSLVQSILKSIKKENYLRIEAIVKDDFGYLKYPILISQALEDGTFQTFKFG